MVSSVWYRLLNSRSHFFILMGYVLFLAPMYERTGLIALMMFEMSGDVAASPMNTYRMSALRTNEINYLLRSAIFDINTFICIY